MTDAELWSAWRLWMAVAAIVVLIAAALLAAIWVTARRILAEAQRALAAAETIQRHTRAIWALQQTNEAAERIAGTVDEIARKGGALAATLEGATVGRHAE